MQRTSSVVEVEGFSKNYGEFAAVRDLSFAVRPGEIIGIVGANGAGKTTTLLAITGILRPTGRTIRLIHGVFRSGSPRIGFMISTRIRYPAWFGWMRSSTHRSSRGFPSGVNMASQRSMK